MNDQHVLKTYREQRGITQDDLAKTLGVSSVTVSRWETGARRIDTAKLDVVAEKTGIPKQHLRPDLAEIMRESLPSVSE